MAVAGGLFSGSVVALSYIVSRSKRSLSKVVCVWSCCLLRSSGILDNFNHKMHKVNKLSVEIKNRILLKSL